MIDTSPWSSWSHWSPWLACSSHTISSTGPSVSSFRDFFSILLVLTYFNVWYIFNIKAKTFLQNHDFPAKTTWIVIKDCGKVDVVRTSGCCCWWQLTANVTSCLDTEPPAVIHLHSWTVSNWLKFTQRKNRGVILVMKTIFKISLRKWGRVSDQRSKNQPTNKQELALRICENTCTEDLSSSDFRIHENENHLEVRRCGCASSLQEPFHSDLRETFEGCVTTFVAVFVDNTSIEYSV